MFTIWFILLDKSQTPSQACKTPLLIFGPKYTTVNSKNYMERYANVLYKSKKLQHPLLSRPGQKNTLWAKNFFSYYCPKPNTSIYIDMSN